MMLRESPSSLPRPARLLLALLSALLLSAAPRRVRGFTSPGPCAVLSQSGRRHISRSSGDSSSSRLYASSLFPSRDKSRAGRSGTDDGSSTAEAGDATAAAPSDDAAPSSDAAADSAPVPAIEPAGIGGVNGASFDVNSLKRNRLQEVLRTYKAELHALLRSFDATEREVTDKLAALVQSSPVRTTTDSNLLDGTWALAYRSRHCTVVDLRPRRGPAQSVAPADEASTGALATTRRGGKERLLRKFFRTVQLEEAEGDAFVEDTAQFLGPLLRWTERYRVCGLTRQSLALQRQSSRWHILRRPVRQRTLRRDEEPPVGLQVVYLDVDLCILSDAEEGDNATFSVYTKNPAWLGHSTPRQVRLVLQALRHFIVHRLLRRDAGAGGRSGRESEAATRIVDEIRADSSKLRVLRLGGTGDVDEAWEGKEDPFVHLSADERQEAIKTMNMREIELAANKRLSTARRESWLRRLIPRKRTFRKPKNL